jgi:imidazolonepropionase-like amidohydrolase
MPIHEIEWMQEAGMTPLQIIVAATRNGARSCNIERKLGTLEKGKLADVLVVDGDPLVDVQALTNVRLVLLEGKSIFLQRYFYKRF